MSTINYLFVASKKLDDPEHLSISFEIIFDVVDTPRWNFYGFKRALPKVKSNNGNPGLLETTILNKDSEEIPLIENFFKSKIIHPELSKFIQEKVFFYHKKTLSEINELDVLLKQICRTNYFEDGSQKTTNIIVQVCIETINDFTPDFTIQNKFKEEINQEHRSYSGGKYLSWFGELTDTGKIELSQDEIIKTESQSLENALQKRPNQIFEILIEKYTNFSKNNLDLFIKFHPDPGEKSSSKEYIEILMKKNFISNLINNSEFLSILRKIETESQKTLKQGSDIQENTKAYQILKHIQKITNQDLGIESIIFSRLKIETDPEIQTECIKKIASTLESYKEKKDSIEYSINLMIASEKIRMLISNQHALLIFLQHAYSCTSQYIEKLDIIEEIENTSEFIKLSDQINRHKAGSEDKLISKIPKLIEKGEYNKSIFLLNKCFPYLVFSASSLNMAELYIECLLAIDGERTVKIIKSFDVLMQRLKILSLGIDFLLKSGEHETALKFLGEMNRIEPTSALTIESAQKIKRAEHIYLIGSQEVTPESLQNLTGIEFENLLKKKFIDLGFHAIETPVTGDYGADLIIEDKNGTRYIVQCKRFSSKVNLKAVQEVVGALSHYAGDYGIVITNNQFLPSAIKLAESNKIELWDGDKLLSFFAGEINFSVVSEAEL